MAKKILIKPIITEKSSAQTESANQYTFKVDKKANKIEIKKAIEKMYGIKVESVNTIIVPSKKKVRNTRSGLQKGSKSSYKKAIVKLTDGETIDFFGDI
mgnify:CR=1 FL=1